MAVEVESKQGSLWNRWDPHIHAPGTVLNDQYKGGDPWKEFLSRIDSASPAIRALGITDYFSIDTYEEVVRHKNAGQLPNVGFIFPNVELRIGIATSGGSAINLHLLCSPEDPEHPEKIRRFLSELEFVFKGNRYRCEAQELIRLGKAYDTSLSEDRAALSAGTNQFKVNFDELRDVYNRNEWARRHVLIAVAGGSRDGTSGLSADSSFAATRKEIERLAHVVLSASPQQREFWLGRGAATKIDLQSTWGGMKPCLHGSDAHEIKQVGAPDMDRICWIKGDLTFESLRQICLEPEDRCFIGPDAPRGSLASQTITALTVSGARWLSTPTVVFNRGLVAVIGARGSGKTALVDLVAAAGYALSPHLTQSSFVQRASEHLSGASSTLTWEAGAPTSLDLRSVDGSDLVETPRVQYLSQHFVEQLCSAEGIRDELMAEIERVVLQSHPLEDRMGATSFQDLLELRAARARLAQRRQHEALDELSESITIERARHASLGGLKKQLAEKAAGVQKDKSDRKTLVSKGNEERARRLEQLTVAADEARVKVEVAKRRQRSLLALRDEVADTRNRVAVNRLADLAGRFMEAGLSLPQWTSFRLEFVGDVDSILREQIAETEKAVKRLAGPAEGEPPYDAGTPPSSTPLIAESVSLQNQTLSLLEKELHRLRRLVGIDAENIRKYSKLSEKISKEEALISKLKEDVERADQAQSKVNELMEKRRQAYRSVVEAIIEEEKELSELYAPLGRSITSETGALGKLSFSVRRAVDVDSWAQRGEELLDLRKGGPFKGKGALHEAARAALLPAWQRGSAEEVSTAMAGFRDAHESGLRQHAPVEREQQEEYRSWAHRVAKWLYSTDHIKVAYSIRYDGADIERLSPGTRGIVLLLLYLAIDADDDRPLVIDQPEENLDPRSIYDELVKRFREAKSRRQIIMVTHNANLVVNTDADQVIVAQAGPHRPGHLPEITYVSGGLENPAIRKHVCEILEGGEAAFRERAKRLRITL